MLSKNQIRFIASLRQKKFRDEHQLFIAEGPKIVQELLRLYVAYDIIELDEEEFREFIAFMAIDDNFLKTASDMELITYINDKFEHYQRIR